MTKINVKAHLKRYVDVETTQKLELIEGLKMLIEDDRQKKIIEMRDHLQQLESGTFPITQKPIQKPEAESDQQDTVEEPTNQTEATQEEALSNL